MIEQSFQKKHISDPFVLIMLGISGIALFLRFVGLGTGSLNETEAGNALAAFTVMNGQSSIVNSQPLYLNITSIIFWLNGISNFNARISPAIIGSLLCLAPILIRRKIGATVSIILGALIAIEPTLVAVSRQADSTILAVAFISAALIFFWIEKPVPAGFFIGMALLSGSRTWLMIMGVLIAWASCKLIFLSKTTEAADHIANPVRNLKMEKFTIVRILVVGAAVVVIFGTILLTRFGQINGVAGGIIDFFQGWKSGSNLNPVSSEFFAIMLFTTLIIIIIFFVIGFIDGIIRKDRLSVFLGIYFLSVSLLLIFWPGRRLTDVSLIIVPVLLLVAYQVEKVFLAIRENIKVGLLTFFLQFSLLVFAYLNLLWLLKNYLYASTDVTLHIIAAVVAVILVFVITFLEAWGWSWQVARSGLMLTLVIVLGLNSIRQTGKITEMQGETSSSVISQCATVGEQLLKDSIEQVALMNGRSATAIDVALAGGVPDSLRWALVSHSTADFPSGISPLATPSILLSFSDQIPQLAYEYRGQVFVWSRTIEMEDVDFLDWLNWVLHGRITNQQVPMFFWVRTDLLPDSY